jgi:hypothetical protein
MALSTDSMELVNRTPFAAERIVLPDPNGGDLLVAAVKCTYLLTKKGRLEPADAQFPVQHADDFHGEPGTSSVRWESDLAPFKPATDVALLGHAHAPNGPEGEVHVSLRAGLLHHVLAVFGDRHWRVGFGMSSPKPFERMPLIYERAFGGTDRSAPEPQHHEEEARNPVGRGFRARRSARSLGDILLPNVEDPRCLIGSPGDRPAPAGYGFIARQWEPRRRLAGTYDRAWRERRAPLLAEDFDDRHHNAAAPSLIATPHLKGDEVIELIHLSPRGPLRFQLPGQRPQVSLGLGRQRHALTLRFDTLVLLPDDDKVVVVWRGSRPLIGDELHRLEWLEVALP